MKAQNKLIQSDLRAHYARNFAAGYQLNQLVITHRCNRCNAGVHNLLLLIHHQSNNTWIIMSLLWFLVTRISVITLFKIYKIE